MARYAAPKSFGSVFNSDSFLSANTSGSLYTLALTQLNSQTENVAKAVNIVSGSDSLSSVSYTHLTLPTILRV